MNAEILEIRNFLASEGTELTPAEVERVYGCLSNLRDSVKEAVKEIPNYYMRICNLTTEEKLIEIKKYRKIHGDKMTLKDYNEILKLVKIICENEGYDRQK
jgi:hypothetical protein